MFVIQPEKLTLPWFPRQTANAFPLGLRPSPRIRSVAN